MRYVYLILKLAVLVLLLVLTFNNMQTVPFNWAPRNGTVEWPLIVFLFIAFVLGIIFGALGMSGRIFSLRRQVSKSRSEARKLAKELRQTSDELSEKNTFINETVHNQAPPEGDREDLPPGLKATGRKTGQGTVRK